MDRRFWSECYRQPKKGIAEIDLKDSRSFVRPELADTKVAAVNFAQTLPLRTNSKCQQNAHLVPSSAQFAPGRDYLESGRLLTGPRRESSIAGPTTEVCEASAATRSATRLRSWRAHASYRRSTSRSARLLEPKFGETRERHGKTKGRN